MYLFNRGNELYANDPAGLSSNPRISFHICQKMLFSELNDSKNECIIKDTCRHSDIFAERYIKDLFSVTGS